MSLSREHYKKILCIRTDRLGDMLVTTPGFKALRQHFPSAQIDVLASQDNFFALNGNNDIDKVLVFYKNKPTTWLKLFTDLFKAKYDLVIVFSGGSKTSAWLAKLTNCKTIYAITGGKKHWIYTKKFFVPNSTHQITSLANALNLMGIKVEDTQMSFFISEQDKEKINNLYPRKPDLKRVGLFIGNIKKERTRWPVEKFKELSDKLLKHNLEVFVVAGPGDVPLLEIFKANMCEHRYLYISSSLSEAAALIKTFDLFVTSSSGPQHVAVAIGTTCLGVTHRSASTWTPFGEQHTTIFSDVYDDTRPIPVDIVYETALKKLSLSV
ncbi:glycosyltransferase family 9 protein [Desulfovibrio litoralis]|uniref:ADP-heptose:LPS heptosyltransferase n=1 Tax=Desulfovibrio litoralis DSM 11393 TaxID=1121455 RepID=A0A1M7SQK1_9BACT|nr:glycosyltransferase family 9 protein [Desulfovibrio litoralis]SHN60722.1 ADP-heptose:LPS heptosyltransferase [Desulfovibrio litoralis DSM 11393]